MLSRRRSDVDLRRAADEARGERWYLIGSKVAHDEHRRHIPRTAAAVFVPHQHLPHISDAYRAIL